MPRTPTISFKRREYDKLEQIAKNEGYPSVYAYMEDLIKKNK